jgi:serine/threonine-protein kinase RsbW
MKSEFSRNGIFPGTTRGIIDASRWTADLSAEHGFPEDLAFGIQLCIEELFTNAVRHGGGTWEGDANEPGEQAVPLNMSITITRSDDVVTVILEDDGRPFDVAAAPAKPVDRPLEAARPGGLGIQLIKQFSSELFYDNAGGVNRTTLKFLWPHSEYSLL